MAFSVALLVQVALVALVAAWAWRTGPLSRSRRLASAGWAALLGAVVVSFVTPFVVAGLAALNIPPPSGLGISTADAIRLATPHATGGGHARLLGTRAIRSSDVHVSPDGWKWVVYFQREGCGGTEAILLDYLSGSYDGQGCPADPPLPAASVPTPQPSPREEVPSPTPSGDRGPCDITGLAARAQELGAGGAAVIDAVLDGPPCHLDTQLTITLLGSDGQPLAVQGNPSAVHAFKDIPSAQVAAEWLWQNWCGRAGSVRAMFVAGDNLLTWEVPLRNAARCDDAASPSTLAAIPG